MRIVFLSNQLFDFPLKTNKWHVATRVAERGHQVLFIDPPIRFRKLAKQIFERRWSLRRVLTGVYRSLGGEGKEFAAGGGPEVVPSVQDTISVFTPLSLSVSEAPNLTNFNILRMKKQSGDFFDGDGILWVYNPAMDEYIEKIPHRLLVYDCVDDYPSMANYVRLGLSEEIARKEETIAKKADIVFATTQTLAKKLSAYNKNVHYVGNAGDYSRFAPVGKARLSVILERTPSREAGEEKSQAFRNSLKPGFGESPAGESAGFQSDKNLEGIPHPRLGFTGAIDEYKLDLSLLVRVAQAYPKYSLVLVGPQGVADSEPNLSELKNLPNVYFIGTRPYEEMPAFFVGFDCYIIPYNLNDYTLKGCFPVKFFDSLAAGLPTVVTNLPSYAPFSEVCYIAKDKEEFVSFVDRALQEDSPEKIRLRMKVAKENSWDKKVDQMLEIISTRMARTSIE